MNSLRLILITLYCSAVMSMAQAPPTESTGLYQSDFNAIKEVGNELFESLKPSFRAQLSPSPIWYKNDVWPYVRPFAFENDRDSMHIVFVSAGFVQLVNSIAHAKAIDKIEPGFFAKYVQILSQESQGQAVPDLPDISSPRYWTDDVINEQLSYFNQIVGAVAAISLAHHYLGHYQNYEELLQDSAFKPVTITESCTPSEWESALKLGAANALECGYGVEGLQAFYDCIVQIENRRGWTSYFLPAKVTRENVAKTKKTLQDIENRFFGQIGK